MKTVDDSSCFVCGENNEIGFKVRPDYDSENLTSSCELEIPPRFEGWKGITHGGIVGTLLDELSVYACAGETMNVVTAELNVKYKQPVPVGEKVFVSAKVSDIRRNVFIVDSKIECNGKICAVGKAKIFNLNKGNK